MMRPNAEEAAMARHSSPIFYVIAQCANVGVMPLRKFNYTKTFLKPGSMPLAQNAMAKLLP
jgi:hypothetical protein